MDEAPGWDALAGALHAALGREADHHYGTLIKHRLGGPDPLDGIDVYRVDGPPAHWLYVTYGFTELYEGSGAEESGYGFELCARVAAGSETSPPVWVLNLLQNLARYVFRSGNVFSVYDHLDANGPIAAAEETALTALCFAPAVGLPATIDSPNGRFDLRQLVGLTAAELEAAQRWNTAGVLAWLQARDPLLITDLHRSCASMDPAFQARVTEGIAEEGSSMGRLMVEELRISGTRVTLGALVSRTLPERLRSRLPFGRSFTLLGRRCRVVFEPGAPGVDVADGELRVRLGDDLASLEAWFPPHRGTYDAGPISVVVEPSHIRDDRGQVVETVG
jgi:hypothetical protein